MFSMAPGSMVPVRVAIILEKEAHPVEMVALIVIFLQRYLTARRQQLQENKNFILYPILDLEALHSVNDKSTLLGRLDFGSTQGKNNREVRVKKMESDLGKLFIGGISWDTNEDHLKEYFEKYGQVVEALIMKDRTTGRARGFGFVVFADPSVAEIVVMNKHTIDGRMVEAKKAVPRDDQHILNRNNSSIHGSPGPARTKKIFVGGLASTVTESDFKRYFDQFGTIIDVVVMYDHNTQRPRGFGFITYDSEEAVERVLLKTFHELNGKMVEVKRAVPKELSPGPSRSPLGGYNYSLSRVNSFLNGYTQGYNPSSVGGYGVRMDGRFNPVASGRSGFPPFGPPDYGMGVDFEQGLSPSYGGSANFSTNLGYGRGLNPYYSGNSNRFISPIGYGGGNGGSSSILSSTTRNVWGNGGLNYATNSANSSAYMGSGSESLGGGAFGSSGVNWGSLPVSTHGGESRSGYTSGNLGYGSGYSSYGLGRGGYGRNSGTAMAPVSSYAASSAGYDGSYRDFYAGGSVYGDPTWQSATSELDGTGSFGYGLDAASDVTANTSAGFAGGYSVTNRQSNRGKWNCYLRRSLFGYQEVIVGEGSLVNQVNGCEFHTSPLLIYSICKKIDCLELTVIPVLKNSISESSYKGCVGFET
ncbi:hypothetical protein HHK36_005768 [Tetracentron sinense]|uniref:RRM domain-containing protein n=1 Tax=Tetracentron sinense TaxID=13715 RepID=A0A834ZLL3_TETSI|nr:hypothetical protein HHK36_005768 [Tetracentron sinense]